MKSKPWFKYLVYLVIILSIIYLDLFVGRQQATYRSQTFNIGLVYSGISMIIRIVIGFILGLEYITNERKKEGEWKINLPRIILIVIPALYFSLTIFFYFIPNEFLLNILMKPAFILFKGDFKYTSIFQILLGYFYITSFYKQTAEI